MAENLNIFGTIYSDVSGIKAYDENGDIQTYIKPEGNILINTTGQIDVSHYATASANMAALINNQNKEVSPTTSKQEIIPDSGYTGLNKVTVNAMPVGTATTPNTTITTNPTISVDNNGLITVTDSKTESVTPMISSGYVSSGTAGTITVEGSNTQQLTTQGATTYTPTTTNQIIASGTYLTGVQTIAGDADLVPSNIKKDVNIFGVTGTYETPPNVESLTVTPTESQQVFTGETPETTRYTYQTVYGSSILTIKALTEGERYYAMLKYWHESSMSPIKQEEMYFNASSSGVILDIDLGITVTLTTITATNWTANTNYDTVNVSIYKVNTIDGYLPVTVNAIPSGYIVPTGTINITQNGTVDVSQYASATIAVAGSSAIADEIIPLVNGGDHHSITGVDLSFDTVTASSMLLGTTAHDSAGNAITGTYVPSGSEAVAEKDVNFYDYDGTLLHSYTAQEFAQLNDLPENPSHSGLVAQGWNWTKTEITTQLTNVGGVVNVGQMYITQSGDTEIDVNFPDSVRLSPKMTIAVNGTITVDWGDNTTPDTVTGTSLTTRLEVPHTYASEGDYTIVIHVVSGSFSFYCASNYQLLRKGTNEYENIAYTRCIQHVRLGSNMADSPSAFFNCYSLKDITIPTGTPFSTSMFRNCYSLQCLIVPSGVDYVYNYTTYECRSIKVVSLPPSLTRIGASCFRGTNSLSSITIPYTVSSVDANWFYYAYNLKEVILSPITTSLSTNVFYGCYSLTHLTIPSGVTLIQGGCFSACYGMAEYHFLPTTPPTLENTSAFTSIPSDCKIYVPRASLATYQAAENWSTYASYMVGE